MSMNEKEYAKKAEAVLKHLQDELDEFDPDEVEGFLSMGVLKVTFFERDICIINSHQAAKEIWMAYDARAWHFGWKEESGAWLCTKSGDELYRVVSDTLSRRLEREIEILPAS